MNFVNLKIHAMHDTCHVVITVEIASMVMEMVDMHEWKGKHRLQISDQCYIVENARMVMKNVLQVQTVHVEGY